MTSAQRPEIDAMVDTLVEWVASGADVTEEDRRRAREALEAIGVPELVEALDTAERIILFGNCFHTVAGFFAAGSPEQDYLRKLTAGSGDWYPERPTG